MPSDDKSTPTDPAAAPPADPAATPAAAPTVDLTRFVSREDYDRLEANLAQQGRLLEAIAGGQQRAVPATPQAKTYSDDELAEMLESGEGRKILLAQRIIAQQQLDPVVGEFRQFRSATMETAGRLGRRAVEAAGQVPYLDDPQVKREVEDFLAKLPPEARANEESLVLAHNYVVAQPHNMQRIIDKAVEAKRREEGGGREPAGTPRSGVRSGERIPASDGSVVPTVRELLGDAAAKAIRDKGQTADEWVRKTQRGRHKNWKEYAAYIQAQQAEEGDDDVSEDANLQ